MYNEASRQFEFGLDAGYARLDAEAQANVGFRLLDLVEQSIGQCAIPRKRNALRDYIAKLESMLAKAEMIQAEMAKPSDVPARHAAPEPATVPDRETKMVPSCDGSTARTIVGRF
jgi:hypothetical protein